MKKITSIILTLMLTVSMLAVTTVSAQAKTSDGILGLWKGNKIYNSSNKTVDCEFFILNEGLPMPTGTANQPTSNYQKVGDGKLLKEKVKSLGVVSGGIKGAYNENGVDMYIKEAPETKLPEGLFVIWYVVKDTTGKGDWHVDGVIVPYYVFVYSANCNDSTGSVTDATHYYEGESAQAKKNGYSRTGYEFIGWNTEADGSGRAIAEEEEIEIDSIAKQGNTTITILYAQWKLIEEEPTEEPEEEPTVEPEPPYVDPNNTPAHGDKSTTEDTATVRMEVPRKMAIRFEDGTVYYGDEFVKFDINKEYSFQMCSVNWANGKYDDYNNGLCGTVVYTMEVIPHNEFVQLREAAKEEPARYTIKGDDIIDNVTKKIYINASAGDLHLETDVNNFFMAYRFHFTSGDYNKQTGIKKVVNTPLESLSVNLPLGSSVLCDAYKNYNLLGSDFVFVQNNTGIGAYESVYLTSVNDYYWAY